MRLKKITAAILGIPVLLVSAVSLCTPISVSAESAQPVLSQKDAEMFTGFILNDGTKSQEDIHKSIIYKVVSGSYKGDDPKEVILAATSAIRCTTSLRTEQAESHKDYLCGELIDYLNLTDAGAIAKIAGQLTDGQVQFGQAFLNIGPDDDDSAVRTLLATKMVNDNINKGICEIVDDIIDLSPNSTFSSYDVWSTYSTVSGQWNQVQGYFEKMKAAYESGALVFESEYAGRYGYFSLCLSNYDSMTEELADAANDCSTLAYSDLNVFSMLLDGFSWLTGKDNYQNHYETIRDWAKYVHRLERYAAGLACSADYTDYDYLSGMLDEIINARQNSGSGSGGGSGGGGAIEADTDEPKNYSDGFDYGKLHYHVLDSDLKTCTVDGFANGLNGKLETSLVIPSSAYCKDGLISKRYSVVAVSDSAFFCYTALTALSLPYSLDRIGNYAFQCCSGIKRVSFPPDVYCGEYSFANTGIETLVVPHASQSTFNSCHQLKTIFVPDGCCIYKGFFRDCDAVTSIVLASTECLVETSFLPYCFNFDYGGSIGFHYGAPSNETYYRTQYAYDVGYVPKSLKHVSILGGSVIPESFFSGMQGLETVSLDNSITEIRTQAFFGCAGLKAVNIPAGVSELQERVFYGCASLTSVDATDTLTVIGEGAFENCTALKNLSFLPQSVTEIQPVSFAGCTGMTDISIPGGVRFIGAGAFGYCKSAAHINVPTTVSEIGDHAFAGCGFASLTLNTTSTKFGDAVFQDCQQLRSVYIADGVQLGNRTFAGCPALTEATVLDTASIGTQTFWGNGSLSALTLREAGSHCLSYYFCGDMTNGSIPTYPNYEDIDYSGVTSLGGYPKALKTVTVLSGNKIAPNYFQYASEIENFILPEGTQTIGSYAFANCTSLTSIVIPDSVTEIGGGAFSGCTALTSVTVPGTVKTLGAAFGDCSNLKTAVLEEGIETIDAGIFTGCYALEELTLPFASTKREFTMTEIPDYSDFAVSQISDLFVISSEYRNKIYLDCKITDDYSIRKITVTGGDCIPQYAFNGMDMLEEIVLPDDLKVIGSGAFRCCTGLSEITIPGSVTYIGEQAFCECTGLTNLFLPDSLEEIGGGAVWGCAGLTKMVIPDSVYAIGNNTFIYCNLEELTLPFASTSREYTDITEENPYGIGSYSNNRVTDLFELGSQGMRYNIGKITITGGECIPAYAFSGMSMLKEVILPASIQAIGYQAFYGCTGLSELTIRNASCYFESTSVPNEIILCGWLGSTAQAYAEENGNPFIPLDPPVIETQPNGIRAAIGSTAKFKVAAAGAELSYQWQYNSGSGWKNSNGTGAKTDTLSISVTAARNGWKYRCIITDRLGRSCTSGVATLKVKTVITAQPASISAPIGEAAKFTVAASGAGLTYQWQYNKGDGWKNSGATGSKTTALTINSKTTYNGWQYRCVITDANGVQTVSGTAKLTVRTVITAQPASISAPIGEAAKFTVAASGAGLTYQWQYNKGDGWKISNGSGSKTATLSINTAATYNGWQYRCVITDANGTQTISGAAKLTVKTVIVTQPNGYQAALNEAAKFTVAASGAGLTYQWQYNKGDGWKNSGATGSKTTALTINSKTTYNGWQYRCVITDANGATATSSVATLKIKTTITAQPANVSAAIGDTANFTVKANGLELSYQWQYNAGAGWKNSGAAGAATATLAISAKTTYNGYQYRCVITDGNGNKTISAAAALTIKAKITAQPASITAATGTAAVFTVKATGMELSYQWQYNSGTGWKTSNGTGAKTAALTINAKASYNGWQYRCVVTDANGNKVISSAATLKVKTTVTAEGEKIVTFRDGTEITV